ncbi:MAG: DNA polymerase III subunit delta' [Burkholderiales bacterium]|nr:DNA polymerase III subunit delta' [Burkholderiales bacterium]
MPWQLEAWRQLNARRAALPHALLIQGRPGLGKTHLARAFAQSVLCERPREAYAACGACAACGWFEQGNHPDYRQLQPEALDEGARDESASGEGSAASRQIRIDQVRELQPFLRIGTHRGGLRIALIRPAEAMNVATANALLKSLEEPPEGTLLLLVSSDPQRLLPTVRSRCQAVTVAPPDAASAAAWLRTQGIADPEGAASFAANAPLAALEQAGFAEARRTLTDLLAEPDLDPVRGAEKLLGQPVNEVVIWFQKWIYDLLRMRWGALPRYHPGASTRLARLAGRLDPIDLTRVARKVAEARGLAQHPLNPKLLLEDLLIQYRDLAGGRDV